MNTLPTLTIHLIFKNNKNKNNILDIMYKKYELNCMGYYDWEDDRYDVVSCFKLLGQPKDIIGFLSDNEISTIIYKG